MKFFIRDKHHIMMPKYFVSGALGAVANLELLYILVSIVDLHYINATFIAVISGIFVSFFFHKFWTFRDHCWVRLPKQLSMYSLIAISHLFLNIPLMYLFVEKMNVWYIYAQILIITLLGAGGYLVSNVFIFKKHDRLID